MTNEINDQVIRNYWQSYLDTFSDDIDQMPDKYEAWGFGNTPEMADRLGNLVVQGIKTATASLHWWYESGVEPVPEVGDYSIILDGQSRPLCVIQTTALDVQPFNEVDAEQAYLEGEGDRSLRYWREVHWDFFAAECAELDKEPNETMPVLCERFQVVYSHQDKKS